MSRRARSFAPWLLIVAVAVPALWAWHRAARATTGTTVAQWKVATRAAAFGPAVNFKVGMTSVSFAASGGHLYAFNNDNNGAFFWTAAVAGTPCACGAAMGACCQTFAGSPIDHVTAPVTLSDGSGTYIFVSNEDGRLYKVNATNGQVVTSIDLKRPGCPNDHLKAAPAVQLAQFSDATFNAVYGGSDIVFVPTAYDASGGCATTSVNRVFAVNATTMAIAWNTGAASLAAYNNPYAQALDEADEGCELDDTPGVDILYCGFRQPAAQKTLVALRTHNASGSPTNKYSFPWGSPNITGVNAGDLLVRPFLRGSNIYVADNLANFAAYNATTGAKVWSLTLNCTTCNITSNTWVEFREGYNNTALAVTADGRLHSITDSMCSGTPCGVESWCRGCLDTGGFNTEPAVDPFLGKIYIGKSDGRLHQLNLTTGIEDGYIGIDMATMNVAMGDPSLDSSDNIHIDRLTIGSGGGWVGRICPPFPVSTMTATPPPPTPPPVPSYNGERAVPLVTCGAGSLDCCIQDSDCFCYAASRFTRPPTTGCPCDSNNPSCFNNPYGANPTCNTFKCDIPTGTCYAAKARDGAACNNGNACELNQMCIDGICKGTPDPACSVTSQCTDVNFGFQSGGACVTAGGINGQCCLNAQGSPACTQTQTSPSNCGSCGGDSCITPAPDCVNGVCCATCGTGACVDLTADNNNCGACGALCLPTAICINGTCEPRGYSFTMNTAGFPDACTMPGGVVIPNTSWAGGADDGTFTTDLAASFRLYNHVVSSVRINADGNLYFAGTPTPIYQGQCPLPYGPGGFVAPFWNDFDLGCAPSRACFVLDRTNMLTYITWENAQFFPCANAPTPPNGAANVTVLLNSNNNIIEMFYGTLTNPPAPAGNNLAHGTAAIVGVEDPTGVQATSFECQAAAGPLQPNLHITFTPN